MIGEKPERMFGLFCIPYFGNCHAYLWVMSIADWLKGKREFKEGAKLYATFGSNNFLKKLFQNETIYTSQKLLEELIKLKGTPAGLIPVKPNEDWNELPPEMQSILTQARHIFKEVAAKHSALNQLLDMALIRWDVDTQIEQIDEFLIAGGSEKLAMEIILGEDEYIPLFEQVDFYRKNKRFPEPTPKSITDLSKIDSTELVNRRNNLRGKISKHKKNEKRKADVAQWQIELVKIQNIINELI